MIMRAQAAGLASISEAHANVLTLICRMPVTKNLKPARLPPNCSLDGRSPNSKFWGKKYGIARMCPNIRSKKLGGDGRQCGLQPSQCMCMCPKCFAPLRALKRCKKCPWGADRSPDASSIEASPELPSPPRPRRWYFPPADPRRGPAVSHPRGSLHLSERQALAHNPPPSQHKPPPSPRPKRPATKNSGEVTWNRTAYATMGREQSVANVRSP